MQHSEGYNDPEVARTETTALFMGLSRELVHRVDPESLQPEQIDPGVWVLARAKIPADTFADLFESHPDEGQVDRAEITYVIEEIGDITLAHIDVEANSTTVFRSEQCNKLELWEIYLQNERYSTVYTEYSKHGHILPMKEYPEDAVDPLIAISSELLLRFRHITHVDMQHLRRLQDWLA